MKNFIYLILTAVFLFSCEKETIEHQNEELAQKLIDALEEDQQDVKEAIEHVTNIEETPIEDLPLHERIMDTQVHEKVVLEIGEHTYYLEVDSVTNILHIDIYKEGEQVYYNEFYDTDRKTITEAYTYEDIEIEPGEWEKGVLLKYEYMEIYLKVRHLTERRYYDINLTHVIDKTKGSTIFDITY